MTRRIDGGFPKHPKASHQAIQAKLDAKPHQASAEAMKAKLDAKRHQASAEAMKAKLDAKPHQATDDALRTKAERRLNAALAKRDRFSIRLKPMPAVRLAAAEVRNREE
jgi:Skp family chaperone for outer membrane proteins